MEDDNVISAKLGFMILLLVCSKIFRQCLRPLLHYTATRLQFKHSFTQPSCTQWSNKKPFVPLDYTDHQTKEHPQCALVFTEPPWRGLFIPRICKDPLMCPYRARSSCLRRSINHGVFALTFFSSVMASLFWSNRATASLQHEQKIWMRDRSRGI